jgi:flagellar biosynthesis protein FlhA
MEAVMTHARGLARSGLGVPLLLILMLAMMVVPLPPFALDFLFTFNISLSLIILLVTIYALRPLDFVVFPSVLLLATLLRLALNLASTRVVLLNGHEGTDAAGRVIQAFGEFVVGGSYVVGLVVFVIFVIINFVVVTKGAGRVSEVNARFTLDAMPGKQMAIDADLNAGLISQEEARARREEVEREADFYGAMDGASKFVRGDAVAGILILVINILGGLAVGVLQHGMPFAEAVRNYTLLTIGDGLVAQIPSLMLSTAAAIIVTRISSAQDMAGQVLAQMFASPRVLAVTAGVLGLLGLIPGMPNFVFLTLAAAVGGGAYLLHRQRRRSEAQPGAAPTPSDDEPPPEQRELTWDDVQPVDTVGLDVGYRLIPLVDRNQGGQLMARIKGVRRKLTQELGFLVPPVHIRDDLELAPTAYRITLRGVPVGLGEVHPERELAINPGQVFGEVSGIATRDPAFGLEAVWIEPAQHEQAQALGYTVVDPATVVATHLSRILQDHAHELLGYEEVQQLLDRLAQRAPKLVEDLVPKALPLGVVVRVLQNLLAEGVQIRDIRTIAETLVEAAARSQDPVALTAAVRISLSRQIVQNINGMEQELEVITLSPDLERILQDSSQGAEGGPGLEPGLAQRLLQSLGETVKRQEMAGKPSVLVVSPAIRHWIAQWLRPTVPAVHVLAFNEIPDDRRVRVVATVGG